MTDPDQMTSSRPYLVRAVHEWIVDNGLTPQLVVDATVDGVEVPTAFVEDGRIVLNIAPQAVRVLSLGLEIVEFEARFRGSPFHVVVPPRAILGVFARENGAGMAFPPEPDGEPSPPAGPDDPESQERPARPTLKVVK